MSEPVQGDGRPPPTRWGRVLIAIARGLCFLALAWGVLWVVICLFTLLCLHAWVQTRQAEYWLLAGAACFLSLVGSLWVCRDCVRLFRGRTGIGPYLAAACAVVAALDIGLLLLLGELINRIGLLSHLILHILLAAVLLTGPVRRHFAADAVG